MKKLLIIPIIFLAVHFFANFAIAQEEVDYAGQPVIDSDLDGLTDEGERQIYKTDPINPDMDNDGIYDGAEIINDTDPFSSESPSAIKTITQTLKEKEAPWAWYATRMAGIIGFVLLYASIFLGLSIRIPILNKIIKPCHSYSVHCWISLQALIFALVHGLALLFEKFFSFSLADIFIPFSFQSDLLNTNYIALGIISFYLMLVLIISSYARRYIGQVSWRLIHFANIFLYIFVIVHAYALGTDLKIPIIRNVFVGLNIFLIFLMLSNLIFRFFGQEKSEDSKIKEACNPD